MAKHRVWNSKGMLALLVPVTIYVILRKTKRNYYSEGNSDGLCTRGL